MNPVENRVRQQVAALHYSRRPIATRRRTLHMLLMMMVRERETELQHLHKRASCSLKLCMCVCVCLLTYPFTHFEDIVKSYTSIFFVIVNLAVYVAVFFFFCICICSLKDHGVPYSIFYIVTLNGAFTIFYTITAYHVR